MSQLKEPVLFILLGLPGSGKTYLARQLSSKLGATHIELEKIRHAIFDNPQYTTDENSVVKHVAFMMAEEFLKAKLPVIYDTSTNRRVERRELRDFARHFEAKPLLIWQQIDPSTGYARVSRRDSRKLDDRFGRVLDNKTFMNFNDDLQTPLHEDYIIVSGKHSFQGQYNSITRYLVETGLVAPDSKIAKSVPNPGLVNLVSGSRGRVDYNRRNVNIK